MRTHARTRMRLNANAHTHAHGRKHVHARTPVGAHAPLICTHALTVEQVGARMPSHASKSQ